MRQSYLRRGVILAVAMWCSQGWAAIDQVTVDRIRAEITHHAEANGETLERFVNRVGSPLWHIESYVYQAEQGEPPRVCRRPQLLRGRGYDEQDDEQVFT